MSCWVAPAVAAELWNVSIDHIRQCVDDGTLASRLEQGFTFVDVAPGSPRVDATAKRSKPSRPSTYTVITQQERELLEAPLPIINSAPNDLKPELALSKEGSGDWRRTRQKASQLRRPPLPM